MSATELARNPRLDEFFVRDLNKSPSGWAAGDASLDAVLCVAGLQYLQQPEAVLAEVQRVLKPGGCVIIAFSNRMFYEKVSGYRCALCAVLCALCAVLEGTKAACSVWQAGERRGLLLRRAATSAPPCTTCPLHCPAPQAIAAWRDSSDWGRCTLVKSYLAAVGGFSEPEVVKRVELPPGGAAAAGSGGPLERLQAWAEQLLGGGGRDPFYAVVAYKLQD